MELTSIEKVSWEVFALLGFKRTETISNSLIFVYHLWKIWTSRSAVHLRIHHLLIMWAPLITLAAVLGHSSAFLHQPLPPMRTTSNWRWQPPEDHHKNCRRHLKHLLVKIQNVWRIRSTSKPLSSIFPGIPNKRSTHWGRSRRRSLWRRWGI